MLVLLGAESAEGLGRIVNLEESPMLPTHTQALVDVFPLPHQARPELAALKAVAADGDAIMDECEHTRMAGRPRAGIGSIFCGNSHAGGLGCCHAAAIAAAKELKTRAPLAQPDCIGRTRSRGKG